MDYTQYFSVMMAIGPQLGALLREISLTPYCIQNKARKGGGYRKTTWVAAKNKAANGLNKGKGLQEDHVGRGEKKAANGLKKGGGYRKTMWVAAKTRLPMV